MPKPTEVAAINLRLALLGLPMPDDSADSASGRLVAPIIARQREMSRRLEDKLCPQDARIQAWLNDYLGDTGITPALPKRTLVLDEPGLARVLSLPMTGDHHSSPLIDSYRLANGVLHNPANDRRTTAGVFHIATGGLPIPDDKIEVDKTIFARLLELAFQPPAEDLRLPFTGESATPAECFASMLLRPLVVPGVPGRDTEKRMETRFIVPGGLVANLDFVEGIFGNGGDPYLPENDASLHPDSWTGHTGAVILAPHLIRVRKVDLGMPNWDEATERQRRDGQCWKDASELYNGGQAFKICARDARGVIVTIIADNYFGYCKKEVKTQISYAANLFGNAEEEHAGGALVYPAYNLGQQYTDTHTRPGYSLEDVLAREPERFVLQPEGHAVDKQWPHIVLVPSGTTWSLRDMTVSWGESSIPLRAGISYFGPDGYRVHLARFESDGTQWSLVGTTPHVTAYHKPATVSGGGKSEVSKALSDAFVFGNAYTPDIDADLDAVAKILDHDFSKRFADPAAEPDTRSLLSDQRSLGSVIKLLTTSTDYTDDYNQWLNSIPQHVKELVYVVKRFYRPEWGTDWRSHFTVGIINGRLGNALRLDGAKIMLNMLRVGYEEDGSWRLFGLRHDFHPGMKVQIEDDITASVVAVPEGSSVSRKYVENCEQLLFQRPDDAIHRGYDKQAERDISTPGTFLSNFQPLSRDEAQALVDDAVAFNEFTAPMEDLLEGFAASTGSPEYVVSSANPRLVNGKPSKNPRYLQQRPDLANPKETAAALLSSHLVNKKSTAEVLRLPIDVVAAGRRNNPAEDGVPPLCAYNPLHYMELPELFMEFISSMTGKSPSTTGAGSEGAMTKGPFNALPTIIDLNAALLSFILTGYDGWLSAAGFVGPHVRVDHDISLIVPEIFSRMSPEERDAKRLIAEGSLEAIPDMTINGREIFSSRLGYRITEKFARRYFGRMFLHPHLALSPEMLRPELQDEEAFAESVDVIVMTHQRVARSFFADGTIDLACPPLRALLEIMANGTTASGFYLEDAEVRRLFDRDVVLASDWYAARLAAKQAADVARAEKGIAAIEDFVGKKANADATLRLRLEAELEATRRMAKMYGSEGYRSSLIGTLGLQPGL